MFYFSSPCVSQRYTVCMLKDVIVKLGEYIVPKVSSEDLKICTIFINNDAFEEYLRNKAM